MFPRDRRRLCTPIPPGSENSYQVGEETVTVCLKAGHFSAICSPSTEKLSVQKLTLYNGNGTLLGRGGNHIGDYHLYEIDLTGSLLEPDIKEYQDLRIVDLLPDGIVYDSIYITQGVDGYPILDGAAPISRRSLRTITIPGGRRCSSTLMWKICSTFWQMPTWRRYIFG